MDKETYKALKNIMACMPNSGKLIMSLPKEKDIKQVESWIDEAEKEYQKVV